MKTWQDLTFDTNAVIEASAGTGKTYTLEHIVEKLVTNEKNPIDIRQILLVTFTEKAAGELKDRIRAILTKAGRCEHVDEATICTIHSFCRQILAEYPFESGADMGADIGGSDDALYARAVHKVLTSKEFKDAHANDFTALMDVWNSDADVSALEGTCVAYLKDVYCQGGVEAWIQGRITGVFEQLKGGLKSLPGWKVGGPGKYVLDHTQGGTTLAKREKDNARYKAYFEKLDAHLQNLLKEDCPADATDAAIAFLAAGNVTFKLQKWDGQKLPSIDFCDHEGLSGYSDVRAKADALLNEKERLEREKLVHDVLSRAYPEFIRLKARSGQMTFDDLIREAARLVEKASSATATESQKKFIERMRERYRIALVDEFQDTDARQWTIFKMLFAEVGRLVIVGDPKQAIYGWRGADLATYLRAREEIKSKGGQYVSLDTMYRSTKEMVADFNTMFTSGWFDEMGQDIRYDEVHFPQEDAPEKVRDFRYPPGEHAVEWLESGMGLEQFAENAANEMIRLSEDQQWKNILPWDKMCVLVRRHSDGEMVRDVLRKKNIPCRIYKEPGIYASIEAESILALFDYLSMPRSVGNLSALLLTPLFNVKLDKLEQRLANGDALFDRLCERWRSLAEKRDWIGLFGSIVCNTGAKHHPAGYRQIFDMLLEKYARSTALSEFAAELRELKAGEASAGENGSIRNRADEGPAVQIMTMHVAKGLEFGAVFVAGGFSGFSKMSKDEKEREIAEQKRLFYVALTRAVFKLYIPWTARGERLGKSGSALQSFLGAAIAELCGNNVASRRRDPGQLKLSPAGRILEPVQFDRPPSRGMKGWRFKWDSFSSLNHHSAANAVVAEEAKKENDEPPEETPVQQKSLLPKGALSGTAFHEVMEILCGNDGQEGRVGFEIGKNDDFESLVKEEGGKKSALLEIARRRLAANGVANRVGADGIESTARTLARMAWNALRTPLDFGGEKFALCEIGPEDRKAEVNFVLDEGLLLAAGESREGALNGSIDLLVRRGDHDYIVDWKTNALDGYDLESVKEAMDAAGYHLQYKIYALAAEKWLGGSVVKGAAYLFVRGGETGENRSGKFVYELTDAERDKFRSEFPNRLMADTEDDDDGMEEER